MCDNMTDGKSCPATAGESYTAQEMIEVSNSTPKVLSSAKYCYMFELNS